VTTANFFVAAPTVRIARLIADTAERSRKDVAVAWLGKELPVWTRPCPIRVSLGRGSGGATVFNFEGGIMTAEMQVEGELDRLLADIVPHEVTHCVLADHFRAPLPRWADEGISVLSETEDEQLRYRGLVQQAARTGDLIQSRALFEAREFPGKVSVFFAQSYWVARVLVDRKDRPTLIQFVKDGMKDGWETAAKKHYGYATLMDLEQEFLRQIGTQPLAQSTKSVPTPPVLALASADVDGRVTVQLPNQSFQPVTTYVQREAVIEKDGKSQKSQYYEPVTSYRLRTDVGTARTYAKGEVKAFRPDGKPVEEKRLLEALKGQLKPVVVSTNAGGITKELAELLKSDALILVVPESKNDAALPPPAVPIGR
jgi:hypothetical protein